MKILFLHPNMPGQYKHLARYFGAQKDTECVFITKHKTAKIKGVSRITYGLKRDASPKTHRYLIGSERAILNGQTVWRAAHALREKKGFVPDIICAHPGWGDALFIKDLFPDTPLLSFFEFYYRAHGADVGFDPNHQPDADDLARLRVKNITNLLSLEAADFGICPTAWQTALHPKAYQHKLCTLHDGVDTDIAKPNADAVFTLPNGKRSFKKGDEIITYIARNFEPYRGFPTFMKAAEILQKARPNAHIIAVGADGVSYGKQPPKGQTYRQMLMKQVKLDTSRIHFVGLLPYNELIKLFQVSAAHIYLTKPFVLSWSMLEAMACGAPLVASNTPPVTEVMTHEKDGLLVDFFEAEDVAQQVIRLLEDPKLAKALGKQAVKTVAQKFALKDVLPLHVKLIESIAHKQDLAPIQKAIAAQYPLKEHQALFDAFD
jgi:glycosyltransferase involved in cell wall biosynthesis